MSNPMQDLHALGLNPFAVTLLAESMLKSAYVTQCGTKPLTFEFPVRRGDCEGWAGVRITIEAVPALGVAPTQAPSLTDEQIDAIAAAQDDEGWFTGRLTKLEWRAFARDVLKAADGVAPTRGGEQ